MSRRPELSPPPLVVSGTKKQYELISKTTEGLHPDTRRFLIYLLYRYTWRRKKQRGEDAIRLPATYLRTHFRGMDWRALVQDQPATRPRRTMNGIPVGNFEDDHVLALFEPDYFEREAARIAARPDIVRIERYEIGRAYRGFMPSPSFLDAFAEAGAVTASTYRDSGLVNLFTGAPIRSRPARTSLNDKARHPYPELVRRSLQALSPCPFRLDAVEAHLATVRRTAVQEDAPRAWLRYFTDARIYRAVLDQRPTPGDDGVWWVAPAYVPQGTGRLTQAGGFQSGSRAMKAAAFADVPGLKNYDFADSHARILIDLLREAGLDPAWIESYLQRGKRVYAEAVGVDVSVWKRLFYRLFNGARTLTPVQAARSTRSEAVRIMREAVGEAALPGAYAEYYEITRPLRSELASYERYLTGPYLGKHGRNGRGGLYVENDVGMKLGLPTEFGAPHPGLDPKVKRSFHRKLLAHVLQGREALLMHELTCRLVASGVPVVGNEHDGLLVIGTVPAAIVAEAACAARLSAVKLEEKPYPPLRT